MRLLMMRNRSLCRSRQGTLQAISSTILERSSPDLQQWLYSSYRPLKLPHTDRPASRPPELTWGKAETRDFYDIEEPCWTTSERAQYDRKAR
jgi:hypothetical protein